MARATARRMPLAVLALPSDAAAHESVKATCGLPQLASIAVWHVVVQGTPEFDMLSAASGATQAPRLHLFPPGPRGLPPTLLVGETFTAATIRAAILRSAALVKAECDAVRSQAADCQRAMAKASRAVGPAPPSTAVAAAPAAAPKPQQQPPPTAVAAPAAPAAAAPAPRPVSAPTMTPVNVYAGKELDVTVQVANVRDSHSLQYFRKVLAAKLGHTNFVFYRRGQSVSSTEEERLIVGDIRMDAPAVPVYLTASAVAMRNAKLQQQQQEAAAAAAVSSSSPPSDGPSSPPQAERVEPPKAQKGPMPEQATLPTVAIPVVFPDASVETLEGPRTSALSMRWARLVERLSSGSIKLVLTSPGCPDEEVRQSAAHQVTLGDLTRYTKVAVKADVAPTKPSTVAPPTTEAGAVRVRLVLPEGGEITAAFNPSDDLAVVHAAASNAIAGDTQFYLQQAYPPKRYTADDLVKSLEALGIRGNVTLRVLRIASEQTPGSGADGAQAPGTLAGLRGMVSGAVSTSTSLVGRLFGGRPSSAERPPEEQGSASAAPAPASAAKRPPPRSMAEIRLREAEEEERKKKEGGGGGGNRYFGGDSTEYQGHPKP